DAVRDRSIFLLAEQDPFGGSVQIFVLTVAQRPQECGESRGAHPQCDRYEPCQGIHHVASSGLVPTVPDNLRLRADGNREAFATTRIEDSDMATAAISGVTWPERAIGMTTML